MKVISRGNAMNLNHSLIPKFYEAYKEDALVFHQLRYYSTSCTNWVCITSSTGDISLTTSAIVYSWLQLPLSEQDIGLLGVLVLAVQCTECRN